MDMQNLAWIIQKPSVGRYRPDVLALKKCALMFPKEGELLVRPLLLSLDPSNLMWLKLLPGWMQDVRIGDVMMGPALAEVEQSQHSGFRAGDLVMAPVQWSSRAVVSAELASRVTPVPGLPLEDYLTIFSHVGRAAYIGTRLVGRVRSGDTVLVSAAAGATGSLACQIARESGGTVIGIAGGPDKCRYLKKDLGIEAAIDYRAEDLSSALARYCPRGVDVFFDNVGGEMLDTALLHLRVGARVVICGAISEYSNASPVEGYRHSHLFQLLMKRARIEGFVVPDFAERYAEIDASLAALVARGALRARTHVLEGLAEAAEGLQLLLTGGNRGKLMVRVQEPLYVGSPSTEEQSA